MGLIIRSAAGDFTQWNYYFKDESVPDEDVHTDDENDPEYD